MAVPVYFADKMDAMLAAHREARIAEVDEKWASLTPREQRLVEEAAVMGYVQGNRAGEHAYGAFPKDSEIVTLVMEAVDSFSDIYPFLAALPARHMDSDVEREPPR